MRPITLTIEGLRSFRHAVTIDFSDRELIAVVGDTGAGKSSILEALTWALYGNATWTKQAGALLGDGCPEMRVRLSFTADAHTWQVTRAVKRRQDGAPGVTHAELVCLDGDRPAADGVRNVNPAIAGLLGLDWEAFTRTVVLPQGQFARLLTEGDVDRSRILAQIWRTDELVAARAQVDEALRALVAHLERLRGRREGYPDDVAAELATARAAARDADTAVADVDAAVRKGTRCRQVADEARATARRIRDAAGALDDAAAGDVAADAAAIAAAAEALDGRLAALEGQIRAREHAADERRETADDDGPDGTVTQDAVTTLDNLSASLDDLADNLRRVRDLRAVAARLRAEVERTRGDADEAEARARDAEEVLARWRRVDAAATAARGLHRGDECPVCAQALPDGWEAPEASGLAEATAALRDARAAAQQARDGFQKTVGRSRTTADDAEDAAARLATRLDRVAVAVAALPPPFRPALPQPFTVEALRPEQLAAALLAGAREAAHERQRELIAREEAARAAREALFRLREERSALRERRHADVVVPATRLRARLERICERVSGCAHAGVALPAEVPELDEALVALVDDARAVAVAAAAASESARAATAAAAGQAEAQEAALAAVLDAAQVTSPEDLSERQAELRAQAVAARARAEELARIVPLVAALDAHLDEGGTVAGALTDLKTLLQDGRFIRWLTLRRSRALLAVASTLLDEMTSGRYAFADITDEHDEWRVFDTQTGHARSPRTLSGGESFVASLALALAMVEMVARSGGRLDALFLDEGFGALDRGNLDAAIDALESSATRGRMVAVISHVRAVAERLTDVLAVDRAPSGSQVRWLAPAEREGAATAGTDAVIANLLT
ncbi:MAG TPA: SMC family ATPase [Egibacteraceae bacterium]|nr:SMC family ATPase [Egibacteraceae bacterium]